MRIGQRACRLLIGITAAFVWVLAAFPAFADSAVGSLAITVKAGEAEGEFAEPVIQVSPSSCALTDVSWSKPVEEWNPGKLVYGYLTIRADEGRFFEKNYPSNKCSVNGADFRSASADSDDPSVLKVTIRYTPVLRLGMTEEAGWSDSNKTRAAWKKVPHAQVYELRVYQDDVWVKTLEVSGTTVDLSPYIRAEGSYFYEVRAKGKTAEDRKYLLTGQYVPSSDVLTVDSGELGDTEGTWRNYQEGKKYVGEDGSFPTSQWKMILGKWYYFDENGYAAVGWFRDNVSGVWYYTDLQGEMQTGWQQIGDDWYYFDSEGRMAVGWMQDKPNEWYYLNPDGSMAKDAVLDGKYVGSDGRCEEPFSQD